MTDELVEIAAKAVMAERIARRAPGYAHFGAGFISPFPGDYADARAVLAAVTPQIEARAREEGAKAMQAAAIRICADNAQTVITEMAAPDRYYPVELGEAEKATATVLACDIAALDPAQIVKGE